MTVKSWTYIKKGFLIPAAEIRYTKSQQEFWKWRHFENEDTLKRKTLWKSIDTLKKKSKKKSSKSPWLTSNLNVDYQDKKNVT